MALLIFTPIIFTLALCIVGGAYWLAFLFLLFFSWCFFGFMFHYDINGGKIESLYKNTFITVCGPVVWCVLLKDIIYSGVNWSCNRFSNWLTKN